MYLRYQMFTPHPVFKVASIQFEINFLPFENIALFLQLPQFRFRFENPMLL